jgi:hypothetical protein
MQRNDSRSIEERQISEKENYLQTEIQKIKKIILSNFIIIFIDILCILIFPEFFKQMFNILTLLMFILTIFVSIFLCLKNDFSQTNYGKLNHRFTLARYLNFVMFLIVSINFFAIIYDRVLSNLFNIIKIYNGGEMALGFLYFGMLIYGTANITFPLWISVELKRFKRKLNINNNGRNNETSNSKINNKPDYVLMNTTNNDFEVKNDINLLVKKELDV